MRARTLVRELEREPDEREDEEDMRRWRCIRSGSTPGTFARRAKRARTSVGVSAWVRSRDGGE